MVQSVSWVNMGLKIPSYNVKVICNNPKSSLEGLMKKDAKKKKWVLKRHKVIRNVLFGTLGVFSRLRYRIKIKKFREDKKRNYLVLFNHQTAFDQFFVGISFKEPVYFVASEDIFTKGWVSKLIKFLVNPIPIKKQGTDVRAILNCMKVAKEGGTIALAPEGNRTYDGKTVYINPTIVPLARKLGLPVLLYRIEGGYGVHPRWSDVVRRGKMESYVSKIIEPEEYKNYSDGEFLDVIKSGLYVDEGKADAEFFHKKQAEYLERAMYVCPFCGLSEFESHGDIIECKKCGRKIKHLPTKQLQGEGFEFPFEFVSAWYDYQCEYINSLDVTEMTENPLYTDYVRYWEVIPYCKKIKLFSELAVKLYGDRIEFSARGEIWAYHFNDISSLSVLGRNKLNIYHGNNVYQLKGGKRFNALKYLNIYHRYRNITKGEKAKDGKFLGL